MAPVRERPITSKLEIPQPKRKALLIGITYEYHGVSTSDSGSVSSSSSSDTEREETLVGPHRDVIDMRALLIGVYLTLPRELSHSPPLDLGLPARSQGFADVDHEQRSTDTRPMTLSC